MIKDDLQIGSMPASDVFMSELTPVVYDKLTAKLAEKDKGVADQLREGPLPMPEIMIKPIEFITNYFTNTSTHKEVNAYTRLLGKAKQYETEGNHKKAQITLALASGYKKRTNVQINNTLNKYEAQMSHPETVPDEERVSKEDYEYAKDAQFYNEGYAPTGSAELLKMGSHRMGAATVFEPIQGLARMAMSPEEAAVAQAREDEYRTRLGKQLPVPKVLGMDADMNLVTSTLLPIGKTKLIAALLVGGEVGLSHYNKTTDAEESAIYAAAGATITPLFMAGGEAVGKMLQSVDSKMLSKLEQVAKFSDDELAEIYSKAAKIHKKDISELTMQDKFIALTHENKTIKALYVQGSGTSEAATEATKKAAEQTMSVIEKLTTISKGTAGQLKEQLRAENKQALKFLRETINNSTKETDRAFAEFREDMYNEVIEPRDIKYLLEEVQNEMETSIVSKKAFNSIVKDLNIKMSNGELPEEVIISNKGELVTLIQHLDQKYTDAATSSILKREQNLPAHFLTDNLLAEFNKGTDNLTQIQFKDLLQVKNVNDRFLNNLAIRKVLQEGASDDIAKALRNFMKTDSYASLSQFLPPKAVEELENIVMKGIFTRSDNALGEDIAVNFWALAKEVDDISYIATPRAKAVVNLIRDYRDYLGSLKSGSKGQASIESATHSRTSPIEEVQSRAVASMFKNIIQYLPTDIGRQTYIVNNMSKIIKGETVLGKGTNSVDLNELLVYKATANFVRTDLSIDNVTFKVDKGSRTISRPYDLDFELDGKIFNALKTKVDFKTVHANGVAGDSTMLADVLKHKIKGLENSEIMFADIPKTSTTHIIDDGTTMIVLNKNLLYKNADSEITLERALVHEMQHAIDVVQKAQFFGAAPKSPETRMAFTKALEILPNNQLKKDVFKHISKYLRDESTDPAQATKVLERSYKDVYATLVQAGYAPEAAKQALKQIHPMELYFQNEGEMFARVAEQTIKKVITRSDMERFILKSKEESLVDSIILN